METIPKTSLRPFLRQAALQAGALAAAALLLGAAVNLLRPDGLPWIGKHSLRERLQAAAADDPVVSLDEAVRLHREGKALFLDARSAGWFEAGRVKGARNLPPKELEARFEAVLRGVDRQTPIVTYCDGETCDLSHQLALALKAKGFKNVRVLVNGWSVWTRKGLPVEEDKP